jgi:hypothetical protein
MLSTLPPTRSTKALFSKYYQAFYRMLGRTAAGGVGPPPVEPKNLRAASLISGQKSTQGFL